VAKNLNAESYSLLLKALHSGEGDATALLNLRESLVRFFQIKGDADAEESADESLDRVAAKLGEAVLIEDLTKYSFGVARLVFLENLRKAQKAKKVLAEYRLEGPEGQETVDDSDDFSLMRECFAELAEDERKILHRYFADRPLVELGEKRIDLAASLGISKNTLRLKIFRLRRRLEDCVREKRKLI
jgi:DNA-directed RNA polymerase specialized sigma24 family protein